MASASIQKQKQLQKGLKRRGSEPTFVLDRRLYSIPEDDVPDGPPSWLKGRRLVIDRATLELDLAQISNISTVRNSHIQVANYIPANEEVKSKDDTALSGSAQKNHKTWRKFKRFMRTLKKPKNDENRYHTL